MWVLSVGTAAPGLAYDQGSQHGASPQRFSREIALIHLTESNQTTHVVAPSSRGSTRWFLLAGFLVVGTLSALTVARVSAARDHARRARAVADIPLRAAVGGTPVEMAALDPDQRRVEADAAAGSVPATKQATLEQSIRYALEHDEVALAYQPIFDLTTHHLVGVEALLRLRDQSGAALPALEVVQAAERSGLIADLGSRVLHLATRQCASWREECGVLVPVAVNVSAAQLHLTDFGADIQAAVMRVGIPAEAIGIELTETVPLSGAWGARQLHELRDAGFELAIDDFGTGYASLTYLQELPATSLKIDASFVAGLPDDGRAVAIVGAVVSLSRNLGIACVAEGIETEAQRDHLRELGVLGQGYLLGRPGDAAAISTRVRQGGMGPLPP